jgi:hypothetical protein
MVERGELLELLCTLVESLESTAKYLEEASEGAKECGY